MSKHMKLFVVGTLKLSSHILYESWAKQIDIPGTDMMECTDLLAFYYQLYLGLLFSQDCSI